MREMGWTWADLEATPDYVRQYCVALMFTRRQAEADQAEKAQRDAERQARSGH